MKTDVNLLIAKQPCIKDRHATELDILSHLSLCVTTPRLFCNEIYFKHFEMLKNVSVAYIDMRNKLFTKTKC